MRLIFTLTVVVALGAAMVSCESAQKTTNGASTNANSLAGDTPITTETATLTVHGMGCPLCANNVDKQLMDVPGVTDVNVDMGSGRVTVHMANANRPTQAQLARAIRQSGFTLVRIDTP